MPGCSLGAGPRVLSTGGSLPPAVHFSEVDTTSHLVTDAQGSQGVGLGGEEQAVGEVEPFRQQDPSR